MSKKKKNEVDELVLEGNTKLNSQEVFSQLELEEKSVKNLRILAKKNGIILGTENRKKAQIIEKIVVHFKQLLLGEKIEILPNGFLIKLDEENRINVSIWFKNQSKKLTRCLESKTFNQLVSLTCMFTQKKREDLYIETEDGWFMHETLALHSATKLTTLLYYNILTYYLAKPKILQEQLDAANRIIFLQEKFNSRKPISWVNFNISYAYYWYIIDNTVKCGIVGRKPQIATHNLDKRLSIHRSSYYRFFLLGVIQFESNTEVLAFEG